MGNRTAIYCRISRDRAGQSLGVKRQEQDCRLLVERHGWETTAVFVDNDRSAYSGKPRPGYQSMLEAIEGGVIDSVVAWHPDRLHRSPTELESFIDLVDRHHVDVATVQAGEYDLSSAAGRMTARVVGAVARHESEHKSERNRRKHVELAKDGRVSGGGRRPFGFERDRLTIREDEAEHIRAAAARVLAGDSIRSIVYDWRRKKVRTVTGAEWSPTTVKRLLMSGRISGQREHRGELVGEAEWPAIIARHETARLRAILSDPSRRPGGTTARRYLLTGFVWCGRCSVKMTTRATSRGKGRYTCTKDRGGCDRCGISAEGLEEVIVEAAITRLDTVDLAERITDSPDSTTDPAAEIEGVENRLRELAEIFAAGDVSRREWMVARESLAKQLSTLQAELATETRAGAVMSLAAAPGSLREAWQPMTLDQRRAVIGSVLDRIVIAPTTRANNRFDADRIEAVWRV